MFCCVRLIRRVLPSDGTKTPAASSAANRRRLVDSLAAGVIGGVSHVFLDSLMHRDMHPFWPFATGNALAGVIGIGTLHGVLGLSGFFGVALWLLLHERR